jgi:BirA family transcriptional regulator, biotin operon repressor / biotin---[acetyl-CoA-carboxylase] ligase
LIRDRLLERLKAADGPISGEGLAAELSISRSAVWKRIQRLRGKGYVIAGAPKVGYELKSAPDLLSVAELAAELPPEFEGEIVLLDTAESTNDVAKDRAAAGGLKPTGLVVAETQTGGRGRFGRRWLSPPGGIWISLVLRPRIPAAAAGGAALLAATAAAQAIAAVTGLTASIKWPNDILIRDRKVCGILIEMAAEIGRVDYLVIGAGINANFSAAELHGLPATTLQSETGRPVDRAKLIGAIVNLIFTNQSMLERPAELRRLWKSLSTTLGKQVSVQSGSGLIEGLAVDIDEAGGLIVEQADGGRRVLRSGEVTFRK